MASKGPKRRLWFRDFMAFRETIYPRLVQWCLFPSWVLLSLVLSIWLGKGAAESMMGEMGMFAGFACGVGVFLLVFPSLVIAGRIPLEFAVVVFKIHERISDVSRLLRDLGEEPEEGAGRGSEPGHR